MSNTQHTRTCDWCGEPFIAHVAGRTSGFCRPAHRVAAHRAHHRAPIRDAPELETPTPEALAVEDLRNRAQSDPELRAWLRARGRA